MPAATTSECINFFEFRNYRPFTELFLWLFKTQRSLHQVSFHAKTSCLHMWRDRSPLLWLHNKSRLFHWCLCNKQNNICPLVDMNVILCSTRYLTSECSKWVRYRVEHSKIKFISPRGHVISSLCWMSGSWKYPYTFTGEIEGPLVLYRPLLWTSDFFFLVQHWC